MTDGKPPEVHERWCGEDLQRGEIPALSPARDLGGWKSPQTILTCYQQPPEAAMREALLSRRTPGAKAKTGTE